jgi:DNA-binding transcriptional MerR regulator|tara:strand:- start:173 stop:571 length:399 start_codon:yes stop_codon:yes gene_type:complete
MLRNQFVEEIKIRELKDKKYMMRSKCNNNYLPITERRIAQFITLRILNPIRQGNYRSIRQFTNVDLQTYYDAIEKYNNGLSLKQIASIINNSNDNNDYDLINLYRNKRLNKKEKLEVINKIKELTKILEDNI